MTLPAGSRLGPYEILAPIGVGGMGEVYRARDTKLSREVAVKILPEAFAANAERLARFQREAQVLASLNHPHIAAIYGLEESGVVPALVLELVEGETLDEKVARGRLPVDEVLGIARQIANALEAAHDKGIIHRDLKPSNVKLTPAGSVKVLDFGLAKALKEDVSSPDVPSSPTMTAAATHAGVLIGTVAYMSPEQARGKLVDKRTDIWAFGAVLYEMLVGRKAFGGETVSDTLAAVLKTEPDWAALPGETPVAVRRLLRRCLDRDPTRRLHDIADARLEIEEAAAEPAAIAAETPSAARRGPRAGALVAAALAVAALASLLTWRLAPPPGGDPVVTKLARISRGSGRSEWPSWSPDGSFLAYASDRGGDSEIYVRRGEGGQDVNITNDPAQDVQPALSPDGNAVAFVSTRSSHTGLIRIGGAQGRNVRTYGGDLWVGPTLGGAMRRLAPDANNPAWRPDGTGILYVSGSENHRSILEVPAGGGAPRAVLPSEASSWEICRLACSPDGRWISFEALPEGILLMPAAGGKPRPLSTGFGHAWDASSGRLYFIVRDPQGGSRIQFVEVSSNGQPSGSAVTVSLVTTNLLDLAVSRDGLRIAVPELEASRNLTRLPLAPGGGAPAGPEEPLTSARVTDSYPSVSPDSRRVALVSDVLGHVEVGVLDVDSRRRERLQLPGEDVAQASPVWMPDGRQLLISRSEAGTRSSIWIVAVDGSRAEELLTRSQQGSWTLTPSPDGKLFIYMDAVNGVQQAFAFDLVTRKASQLTDSPGDKFDSAYSPDGKWVAVTAATGGGVQLFRMPASGGPMQPLTTGYERMRHPFFSPDGKWIYIQPSHRNIYRVLAEGGRLEPVTHFPDSGLFLEEPTISPDGRYLYYCRENGGSSLWLMTLEEGARRR
jgi:Tol biopolymer transport system component